MLEDCVYGQYDPEFFDLEAYVRELRDVAKAQEVTIFSTALCPDQRYLLASSNQGRVAIWDLSSYLHPPVDSEGREGETPAPLQYSMPRFTKPVYARNLGPNQGIRTSEWEQRTQGLPALSFQASTRGISSIVFSGQGSSSLLILGGDEAVLPYNWRAILEVLRGAADQIPGGEVVDVPPPLVYLKAFPGMHLGKPFLIESNGLSVDHDNPSVIYSAGGDSNVHKWDLSSQTLVHSYSGHTNYIHAVRHHSKASLVVSGSEDGRVGVWDVRQDPSKPLKMLDGWQGGAGKEASSFRRSSKGGVGTDATGLLTSSRWVSCLDFDEEGNWLCCGGGCESGGNRFGYLSVFHLSSFTLASSSSTTAFLQDIRFHQNKILSVGNEPFVTHWGRPQAATEIVARVQSSLPSIYSITAMPPGKYEGLTCFGGCSEGLDVFINPENKAFSLRYR